MFKNIINKINDGIKAFDDSCAKLERKMTGGRLLDDVVGDATEKAVVVTKNVMVDTCGVVKTTTLNTVSKIKDTTTKKDLPPMAVCTIPEEEKVDVFGELAHDEELAAALRFVYENPLH